MYKAFHYPPGRERLHAIGALDLALWDLKGKALGVPVYELLGGMNRNYLECYTTTFRGTGTLRERAAQCMEAGWRFFRFDAASVRGTSTYDTRERIRQMEADCRAAREGVGPQGNFAVDFHQRFTLAEAIRGCKLIEEHEPYLVEDPVQTDAFLQDIPKLRLQTSVPLAAGEEWGARWDFHRLVENHDLDFVRCSLPNVGGITEMIRVCALCETHDIGFVPHFTGPIATAAQIHALGPYPLTVVFEYNYGDQPIRVPRRVHHLPRRQTVRERPARPRRHGEHGASAAGRRGLRPGTEPSDLLPSGRLTDDLVTRMRTTYRTALRKS